ncbi:MAG: methyltransferase domain-containing protein [Candidatus Brennerbacteria bacterium]|nr:methyltransferase domain-containing protein [Candidatus Brennerbacteria bacterium]
MGLNILSPGRHHMLTKFQHDYLLKLVREGVDGQKVQRILFVITSANHENTRRNPIPLYLRTLAIDRFAEDLECDFKIYPVNDVKPTDKFAEYILRQIFYQSGEKLTSKNTILACSTPPIIKLFLKLGFKNTPVELVDSERNIYSALRPYEIIDLLVRASGNWRKNSAEWNKYAYSATVKVYKDYALGSLIIEVFQDSLLSEDADITETRDYHTYVQGMDMAANVKFSDIKPFVVEGKIVDVGCSTGSLIKLLAEEFHESDIIGIEAVRRFYEYCKTQEYKNPFVFFYRRNVTNQNFKENTINTFIYSSVMHEVYSYLGEKTLRQVLKNTYKQLNYGGRIIIRDVVGPDRPDDLILMKLNDKNGLSEGNIDQLSTYAKFFRFVKDFEPKKITFSEESIGGNKFIKISRRNSYEYISKMDYTDNWESEMHEEFGFYTFKHWIEELERQVLRLLRGQNRFIIPIL